MEYKHIYNGGGVYLKDQEVRMGTVIRDDRPERGILVGVEISQGKIIDGMSESERSIEELEELAKTAGVEVIGKMLQKKQSFDPATYIGRGKLDELKEMCSSVEANLVIFDNELTGAQMRNIENKLEVKVVDRTMLILDIFAQRAQSSEGKLQVELAQLKYRLPRLIGLGTELSRLGGGIGTRGPGEAKLEMDRRHIRRRIKYLEDELKEVNKRRGIIRSGRRRNDLPIITLVGYTNAGKSSLMNCLCDSEVFVEDKLFATLDPTTRKMVLDEEQTILLVDTVGFVRKLPHELIKAFKSTLEEAVYADVLLHVVDASSEEYEEHIEVAERLLEGLGVFGKPMITVLNKIDLLPPGMRATLKGARKNVVEVSAKTGEGISKLTEKVLSIIKTSEVDMDLLIPFDKGNIVSFVHENASILNEEYVPEGVIIKARIPKNKVASLSEYETSV